MKILKIKNYLQLHFIELKYNFIIFLITFIYLFLVSYFFSNQLIFLFVKNLINYNVLKYFIFTNITDFFFTNIIISIFISTLISLQLLIIQIWFFLSTGLYKYENLKLIKFFFSFIIINNIIIFFIFIKLIPNILLLFIHINEKVSTEYLFNIYFEPNLHNYFYFIFSLYIYIYIVFIYFYSLFYIIFNKIFKIKILINLRKFFYLKFILISNIVAPPELIHQLVFIIIFFFFFEISIFLYIWLYRYFF